MNLPLLPSITQRTKYGGWGGGFTGRPGHDKPTYKLPFVDAYDSHAHGLLGHVPEQTGRQRVHGGPGRDGQSVSGQGRPGDKNREAGPGPVLATSAGTADGRPCLLGLATPCHAKVPGETKGPRWEPVLLSVVSM